jgi:hydroxycarboxylate dehydrogenase B
MKEEFAMPIVRAEALRRAVTDTFAAVGVPGPEATLVADHLVDAELAGVVSHGVLRVPSYVEAIRQGRVVPGAPLTVLRQTTSTVALDGNRGFGQVMARRAMEKAMEMAERTGVAAVTLVNCSHTGRLGAYTEQAARQGLVGLMMVNTGGHGQWVAPFGGTAGRLSTNPFSVALPTGLDFPLMLDFATSVAPEGKVQARRVAGKPIPEGWVVTADGRPTTDPADLYGPPRGALLPFGGHKGFGLGLVVDALAGILSGAGCCADPAAPLEGRTDGVFLVAIRIEAFCPLPLFRQQVALLVRNVKSSPPAPGFGAVLVPGEPEAGERARRERDGIPIEEGVRQALRAVFESLSVSCEGIL